MFDAQYLFKSHEVFGPWMSRGGDHVIATVDLASLDGVGAELYIKLYTKNSEDVGHGSLLSGSLDSSIAGTKSLLFSNTKELVRYHFTVPKGAADGSKALFRMLAPVWFDSLS
jgi:hypothetical protein